MVSDLTGMTETVGKQCCRYRMTFAGSSTELHDPRYQKLLTDREGSVQQNRRGRRSNECRAEHARQQPQFRNLVESQTAAIVVDRRMTDNPSAHVRQVAPRGVKLYSLTQLRQNQQVRYRSIRTRLGSDKSCLRHNRMMLVSVQAVRMIKPNIDVTDNVDRLVVGGDLIEDDGQFVQEHLLYGG